MIGFNIKRIQSLVGLVQKDLVAIDISGNYLKAAHVKVSPHKKELICIIGKNIKDFGDEDISRAIGSCIAEMKLSNCVIALSVSAQQVITKNIEIPSVDIQEIKEIMDLQAGRHTPYSREEIIIDFVNIGVYKHNYSKILLFIVANNIINRQLVILGRNKLKADKVFFACEASSWFLSKILKTDTTESPVILLHIDETCTDFLVVFKEKVIFIRSIPIGAERFVDLEGIYRKKFTEEVRHSLEAYQSEDIEKTPTSMIVTGVVEEVGSMEMVLNDILHIPIKVVPYLEKVKAAGEASAIESTAKSRSFFNVIVPLLAYDDMKVNFVPENVKLSMNVRDRGMELIRVGILILTVFVFLFSIFASRIYFKSLYLKKLEREYRPLNEKARSLENDFTRVSLIRNYLIKRGYSLDVLAEFYEIIASDVEISEIRFDEETKLIIRGTAEAMSTVFSFVESLEKSAYFKDVKTKYTTKRKDGQKDVTDFEINAYLDKAAVRR